MNEHIQVLIVEDETAAYENLKSILLEVDSSIAIAGHTESVVQTVKWLTNNPTPDLIFMDIHLSDGSAFNIFPAVTVETPVIFTTAYDEHAIDAFTVNSIYYLLKPIESEGVKRALDKFRKLNQQELYHYFAKFSLLNTDEKYSGKILIPVNNNLIPVDLCRISYFYGSNNETRAVLKDNTAYHYTKALEQIYGMLNPRLFFRANKQFIVAKSSVKNITVWFDKRLLVMLDTEVPERIYVSKNKAALFKKWLTAN
jgi:DNA-binding LytR/AlgR family response regulator